MRKYYKAGISFRCYESTLVNLSSFQDITRFWRRDAVDRIGCRVQTDDHRWYGVCVWPFHIRHMLFNTTSSTLYFVTNFGLCLSRPWGYREVSFGINEELYMLPELSGKTAPALYLKLKNQRYMKAIQLFMLTASLLMTFTLFIGAFFNPSYWLFVPGMAYLSYLFFKEKRW